MKKMIISVIVVLSTLLSAQLAAEACTYSEGLRAAKNGNMVRSEALMLMAARDGDKRAVLYLEANFTQRSIKLAASLPSDPAQKASD
ncbi:MAG: hypothetical protein ACC707_18520 [Thiohalomonadales bacterium]